MRTIATLILSAGLGFSAIAQTTITNGGFELWGNTVPAGDTHTEPTNWYSDQSGSSTAALGPETCFQDAASPHSGTYCVKVETESFSLGIVTEYINGVVTTGVVNAPTTSKADGYIGTVNFSTATDDRRMAFTGMPDSLVGWYQYSPAAPTERGKVRAILHTGDYYDPETPTTYHPACTANEIADAVFYTDTPGTTVSTWTRFAVPFHYVSSSSPAYIMINVTSSANQLTSIAGSILLLDDLSVVYATPCTTVTGLAAGSVTGTSATISWTPVSGSTGYVYAVNTSATPPATGTYTAATSVPVSGLTAATLYYAHVKDSCAVGSSSAWTTQSFATTGFTGFNNTTAGGFNVTAFPNPVKGEVTINITGANSTTGQLQLMDISGRLISTAATDGSAVNMSMSGLSSGIYFIRYIDAAHTQTIKITKE